MSTFVLVHGSWGGAWCFSRVRPLLQARGHDVFAQSLTGLGDRAHLAGPDVSLSTHIDDVARLLEWEGLDDVVLVGHSYGGMVVSGVANVVPQRIRQLVYLDAFWPLPGQSAYDVMPSLRELMPKPAPVLPWAIPPVDFTAFGVTDPADAAWLARLATPMPVGTHEEPLPDLPRADIPSTFVEGAALPLFGEVAATAAGHGVKILSWPDVAHMIPVTHPDRVLSLLDAL